VIRQTGAPLWGLADTPCLRYPRQATFHPVRYLRSLCEAIAAKGGTIHPHSAVEEIAETAGHVRLGIGGSRTVLASHVVVATNVPVHTKFAYKQAPYRTYAMAFEIAHGQLADALYWDTAVPYHYVRLTAGADGKDLLIVGGEDHKTGDADDAPGRFAALESWIRTLVPELGPETHRCSGQVMETLDHGAYIGLDPDSKRTYVVTGDSGQGITHGVVASLIIPAMITGEESEYAAVYRPARTPARTAGAFVSENVAAAPNQPGEIASTDELGPDEGGILHDGPNKIAAYRDVNGEVQMHSAACTHLGCDLRWNSFERCWDCPCHGSHFAPNGAVLNAPATSPLGSVEHAS